MKLETKQLLMLEALQSYVSEGAKRELGEDVFEEKKDDYSLEKVLGHCIEAYYFALLRENERQVSAELNNEFKDFD